jgi:hypothetical protein
MLDPIGNIARKIETKSWELWFAWYPVQVNGEFVWGKRIYRRNINTYVDMEDWSRYEYGNIFDILKE